jgi:hypothetical protein
MSTPNLGLTLPLTGSAAWDAPLNSNFSKIDAAVPSFTAVTLGGFFGPGVFFPPETISVGQQLVANVNETRACQMSLLARIKPSKISVNVNQGAVSGKAAFGIYDQSGNLLINSGALDCSNVGGNFFSTVLPLTQLLVPGTYYYVWTANSTSVLMNNFTGYSAAGQSSMFNLTTPRLGVASGVSLNGVLPATMGTITGGALTVPSVFFEV